MGSRKWKGSVSSLVDAATDKVWGLISETKRLPEWMPMVERCTDLAGEEGVPGYVRLVSGFMFPREDGERSWIKEKLICMDPSCYRYVYEMKGSNVGLDGSVNSLKLKEYGDESTLLEWEFEVNAMSRQSPTWRLIISSLHLRRHARHSFCQALL